MRAAAIAVVLAIPQALAAAASPPAPPGYAVYQALPVSSGSGKGDVFQILQDTRVSPAFRQAWGSSADPEAFFGLDNPFVQTLKKHPLRKGRLRLIDANGRVIANEALGEPLARIETVSLYGTAAPTYFLTVDYGVGMGSYAGPVTTLLEIHNGALVTIHAAGRHKPITLFSSLKSAWKLVPSRAGQGKEIEQMQCYSPTIIGKVTFVVSYTDYRFIGGYWREATRTDHGFWEGDLAFPPRRLFP